jgi:hypothetical protein
VREQSSSTDSDTEPPAPAAPAVSAAPVVSSEDDSEDDADPPARPVPSRKPPAPKATIPRRAPLPAGTDAPSQGKKRGRDSAANEANTAVENPRGNKRGKMTAAYYEAIINERGSADEKVAKRQQKRTARDRAKDAEGELGKRVS